MGNISKKIFSVNHVFVIAEIGNNHNGNIDLAYKMIDKAKEIGVDCVKFQMRHIDKVYRKKSLLKSGEDLGTEYIIDLLNRFELSVDQHKKLSDYCDKIGIYYMCTPWDLKSIEVLESFNVEAYKVASADLTNIPLIHSLIQTNKPLILSTGMLLDWLGEKTNRNSLKEAAQLINTSIDEMLLVPDTRTVDLAGSIGTKAFGERIVKIINEA